MSIMPAVTGAYQVFFSGTVSTTNADTTVSVSIYHQGAKVAFTDAVYTTAGLGTTAGSNVHRSLLLAVTAGDVVEVRWQVVGKMTTRIGYVFARSLFMIRVGAGP